MAKRILFTVSDDLYRRFKYLAVDRGTSHSRLLEHLLDTHQQLLEFQHRVPPQAAPDDDGEFERLLTSLVARTCAGASTISPTRAYSFYQSSLSTVR